MNIIPTCFFPTTIQFIDDDSYFLDVLKDSIPTEGFKSKFSTKPKEVLRNLNATFNPDPFEISWEAKSPLEDRILDISGLYREIYNASRHNQISTIIVDYAMPGMNGIEFCRQLKSPFTQKILLTNVADENMAVDAFNKKIIHHYIRKSDADLSFRVAKVIRESQFNYFCALARATPQFLEKNNPHTDPAFISYFEKLVKRENIVEYFTASALGNFIMLNKNGDLKNLITKKEGDFKADLASAESEYLEHSSPQLFEELERREKMLFFHNLDGIKIPDGSKWAQHIRPAHRIDGREKHFVAFGNETSRVKEAEISCRRN